MPSLRDALAAPPDPTLEDAATVELAPPDMSSLVRHPDGYYWIALDGVQQFGPFDTAEEALDDLHAAAEEALEPGETLAEAEDELGIADWVDPDTGEPAEGTRTRIEDR